MIARERSCLKTFPSFPVLCLSGSPSPSRQGLRRHAVRWQLGRGVISVWGGGGGLEQVNRGFSIMCAMPVLASARYGGHVNSAVAKQSSVGGGD